MSGARNTLGIKTWHLILLTPSGHPGHTVACIRLTIESLPAPPPGKAWPCSGGLNAVASTKSHE